MAKKTENKEKIEREYVIPLREKVRKVPRYKKANKAIRTIKEFLARHMKVYDRDLNKIKLEKYLNEFVWSRGIKNPPHKIKVKAMKDGEIVKVELMDMPEKLKFKKLREEKIEKQAKEAVEKKKSMMEKAKQAMQKTPEAKKESAEKKVEEAEKKTAVVEEGKELEKEMANEAKHTEKVKSPKEEKENKKEYNKSSRGH